MRLKGIVQTTSCCQNSVQGKMEEQNQLRREDIEARNLHLTCRYQSLPEIIIDKADI